METKPHIQCIKLTKHYHGQPKLFAHFDIFNGLTRLTGANGSGKSTLLRLLAGIEKPCSGEIRYPKGFTNAVISSDSVEIPEVFSGTELSELFIKNRRLDRKTFNQLAEAVSLSPYLGLPMGQLSTGNRKKLSLLLALACPADLYALDEPFNGLDHQSKVTLKERIVKLPNSVIVVDHSGFIDLELPLLELTPPSYQ